MCRSPDTSACVGVDTNRNWDTHWSEPGASDNPCSETYYGAAAFSEPETRLAAEHLDEIGANAYVDVHAYGQMLMYPYGELVQSEILLPCDR